MSAFAGRIVSDSVAIMYDFFDNNSETKMRFRQ